MRNELSNLVKYDRSVKIAEDDLDSLANLLYLMSKVPSRGGMGVL